MTSPEQPKPRSNPRPIPPDRDHRYREPRAPERSLTEAMQPVVDMARQIQADFGQRPYTVHSVVLKWMGGARNKGEAVCCSDTPIVPTPMIDLRPVQRTTTPAGTTERGIVTMSEISAGYTEDDILALFHKQPLDPALEGFIEVRHDRRDGNTKRRRFVVIGTPWHDAEGFQWKARLISQDGDRSRSGKPSDVQFFITPGPKVIQ